ncbi:hypothetical protein ACWEV4_13840 [Streptomyces sp. NPDC003860]
MDVSALLEEARLLVPGAVATENDITVDDVWEHLARDEWEHALNLLEELPHLAACGRASARIVPLTPALWTDVRAGHPLTRSPGQQYGGWLVKDAATRPFPAGALVSTGRWGLFAQFPAPLLCLPRHPPTSWRWRF